MKIDYQARFEFHRKIDRLLQRKVKMADWDRGYEAGLRVAETAFDLLYESAKQLTPPQKEE